MRLTACALWVATLSILSGLALPSIAQTAREVALLESIGRKEAGIKATDNPNHKKLTPEEALRIRILEVQTGERAFANRIPDAEIIIGPPLSEREQIVHVLNRMAFGPKLGQVDYLMKTGGWLSWVEQQLEPDNLADSDLDKKLAEKYPWTKMTLPQIMKAYPLPEEDAYNQAQLRKELPESIVMRAALSNRQFKEVMCEFWRNHLCIDQPEFNAPKRSWTAAHYEENVIRKHVFGKFHEMLLASAQHPGMLEYLDNYVSRKGAWNENYARELMELHTLGADRFYNEQDVLELSLTLTGWTYDDGMKYYFRKDWHDGGKHRVLGRPMPQDEDGGKYAIAMLATHQGTAKYIAEKLCRYLVNDNPPKAMVNKAAETFYSTKGDLKKVYRTIVTHEEFMSRFNYKAKFKTPFEFSVSILRAADADLGNLDSTIDNIAQMGQAIYGCQDPTGYYDYAEAWLDAGVLTRRWNYAHALVVGKVKGVAVSGELVGAFKAEKPDEIKKKVLTEFIGGDVGDHEGKLLTKLAEEGNIARMIAVTLGSPSFQQQ